MSTALRDTRSEKQVEHAGDKAMATLGFSVWRFSQSRATNQSPGIPDRRYVNAVWGFAFWWEAKRDGGKQSPQQRYFQVECASIGEQYVCGTDVDLVTFALALLEKAKRKSPGPSLPSTLKLKK